MMPLTRRVCCATLLLACCVARAREGKGPVLLTGADPAGADVRDAAATFLTRLADGDADGAAGLFAGPAEQSPLLAAYARFAGAADAFDAVLASRPAAEKGRAPLPGSANILRGRAELAKRRLMALNGDEASLSGGGLLDYPMLLRRDAGRWKVADLLCGRVRVKPLGDFLQGFAAAMEATTAKAKAGQLASSDAVTAFFDAQSKPVVEEWLKEPDAEAMEDAANARAGAGPARMADWTPPTPRGLTEAIGRPLMSAEAAALIASLPVTPLLSEGRNNTFVICRPVGVELACVGEGRPLTRIVLYAGDVPGWGRYAGELPHGLKVSDVRRDVERKLGRPTTSSGGEKAGKYFAAYGTSGVDVEYARESGRDPANPVHLVILSAPKSQDASAEGAIAGAGTAAARRPAGLALRVVAGIHPAPRIPGGVAADGVDTFPDPNDPRRQSILSLQPEVVLDESAVEKLVLTRVGDDLRTIAIGLWFTEAGGRRLSEVSEKNIGRRMGIVIDGRLVSAPTIRGRMGRQVVIEPGANEDGNELRSLCGRLHAAVFALRE
jgi:hypothetical protein